jgi:hypothetical protein
MNIIRRLQEVARRCRGRHDKWNRHEYGEPPSHIIRDKKTAVFAISEIERLRVENENLRELLLERDGGVHDSDCPARWPEEYRNPVCKCGHDEAVRALGSVCGQGATGDDA